jgi:hypothetical protein
MKTSYKEIRNDRQWRATTGLSQDKFMSLAKLFKTEYQILFGQTKAEQAVECPQEIHVESEEDLLFMLLFSLKTGNTEDVLGIIFGIERSTFSKNRAIALRVLESTLAKIGAMPKREFKSVEEFEEYMKEHETLIIDGTEHRVQRPDNHQVQKELYSGKKNVTQ